MTTALPLDGLVCMNAVSYRKVYLQPKAYSCVVISSSLAAALDLRVRISPLVLSDHSDVPVFWFRGSLVRCINHWNSERGTCGEALRAWKHIRANYTMRAYRSPETPINAVFKRAIVIHDCFNMRWICRSARRAALHALVDKLGRVASLNLSDRKTVLFDQGKSYFPRRPW